MVFMVRAFLRFVASVTSGGHLAVWLAAMLVAVALHGSTGHDDSHITYWASYSLVELGHIVNYNGEAIEQSSSLLHTIVLAILYFATGLPIPDTAYVLSIVGWGLVTWRALTYVRREGTDPGLWGTAALAFSPMLSYWGLGGLETLLYAWLLLETAFVLLHAVRAGSVTPMGSLVLASTALCRPEAPVLLLSAAGALMLTGLVDRALSDVGRSSSPSTRGMRGLALTMAATAGATVTVTIWRHETFGSLFPAPVAAKMAAADGDRLARLLEGIGYVTDASMFAELPILLMAGTAATVVALSRRESWALRVPVVLASAQLGAAWLTGGDWMIASRFLAHVVPLLYVCLFLTVAPWLARARGRAPFCGAMLALHLVASLHVARHVVTARPVWATFRFFEAIRKKTRPFNFGWSELANPVHLRDALFLPHIDRTIARLLDEKSPITISSGQAGMVMFHLAKKYFGKIRFVDRHGLSTPWPTAIREEVNAYSDPFGVHMPMATFLRVIRAHPEYRPDVIFELRRRRSKLAQGADYRPTYTQTGRLVSWFESAQELRERRRWKEMSAQERRDHGLRRPPARFFTKSFELDQTVLVDTSLAKAARLASSALDWDALRKRVLAKRAGLP